MKTRLVSAELLEAAQKHVDVLFSRRPGMKRLWEDFCATSVLSQASGGVIRLETDYDWIVAALMFFSDGERNIPRDSSK
jgi:hypothetical protein